MIIISLFYPSKKREGRERAGERASPLGEREIKRERERERDSCVKRERERERER